MNDGVPSDFLASVRQKKEVPEGSSIPQFTFSVEDNTYHDLLDQGEVKKEVPIRDYEEEIKAKKTSYVPKVEVFLIDSDGDRLLYEKLMEDMWNHEEDYAGVNILRNWDKGGNLKVVVEYVKIIQEDLTKEEEKEVKETVKKPKGKPEKVNLEKQLVDAPMPSGPDDDFVDM
jgi:hypothetical protein